MTIDPASPICCSVTYSAFRAAFVTTLDSLLRYSLDPDSVYATAVGFLAGFPMLNGMAPQIQLECLFGTWGKMGKNSADSYSLLDELVVYGSYESLARATDEKQKFFLKAIFNGPREHGSGTGSTQPDHWLQSKARCLQLAGSATGTPMFLRELSEIQDPSPWFDGEIGQNWCENRDSLLNLVGRWVASRDILLGSEGLLTQDEQDILRAFFEEHSGLVR